MLQRCRRWTTFAVCSALLSLPVACGPGKPTQPTPVTVSGRVVSAKGNPIANVLISFHAQEGARAGDRPAAALDNDGKFTISCIPGRYKVTIAAIPSHQGSTGGDANLAVPPGKGAEAKAGSTIPRIYSDASSSPWEVTVPPEGTTVSLTVK